MIMRLARSFVVLVAIMVAGLALAGPPATVTSANVIDVAPPAEPAAVVVLRGSSAPPQPWGGPPAAQAPSAPQPPTMTYSEQTYRSEERRVGKECRSRWSWYR